MRRSSSIVFALLVLPLASACKQPVKETGPRLEVRRIDGSAFELWPEFEPDSPLKYCLVFTRSDSGVIRQLTMTHENMSVPCESGKPIADVRFRTPINEGPVQVNVFFSDRKLNAGSIAQQLYEHLGDPSFHPMDLRLPGTVVAQSARFVPEQDTIGSTTGGLVGKSGEVTRGAPPGMTPKDAGAPAPDAGQDAGAGG